MNSEEKLKEQVMKLQCWQLVVWQETRRC